MPPKPTPAVAQLLAAISSIVSLAVTQALISDRVAQIITGSASVIVPLVLALANTYLHAAHVTKPLPAPPEPPKPAA